MRGQGVGGDYNNMRMELLAVLEQKPDNKELLALLSSHDPNTWTSFWIRHHDLHRHVKQVLGLENPDSTSASDSFARSAKVRARGSTCPLPGNLLLRGLGCRFTFGGRVPDFRTLNNGLFDQFISNPSHEMSS